MSAPGSHEGVVLSVILVTTYILSSTAILGASLATFCDGYRDKPYWSSQERLWTTMVSILVFLIVSVCIDGFCSLCNFRLMKPLDRKDERLFKKLRTIYFYAITLLTLIIELGILAHFIRLCRNDPTKADSLEFANYAFYAPIAAATVVDIFCCAYIHLYAPEGARRIAYIYAFVLGAVYLKRITCNNFSTVDGPTTPEELPLAYRGEAEAAEGSGRAGAGEDGGGPA